MIQAEKLNEIEAVLFLQYESIKEIDDLIDSPKADVLKSVEVCTHRIEEHRSKGEISSEFAQQLIDLWLDHYSASKG